MQKSHSSWPSSSIRAWATAAIVVALVGASEGAGAVDPAARPGGPGASSDPVDAVVQPVTQWLERANREYQDNVMKELSIPTGKSLPVEAARSVGQPAGVGVFDQIKGLLGMEPPKESPSDPAAIAAAKERELALTRQIEARKLEQQRNADAQRVAEQLKAVAEARKTAELDQVTRQSQKTAELARLAEEARRKGDVPANMEASAAAERKAAVAAEQAAAEKAETDRRVAAAAAEKVAAEKAASERKVAAAAEKVAAEKAANERKVAVAAEKVAAEKATDAAKRAKGATVGATADQSRSAGQLPIEQTAATSSKSRVKVSARKAHSGRGQCARAGRSVDLPAMYVVKSGDTLWDISRRYYDKGYKFEKIVRANSAKIESPDMIFPCQKIYLPGRHAFFLIMPMDERDAS